MLVNYCLPGQLGALTFKLTGLPVVTSFLSETCMDYSTNSLLWNDFDSSKSSMLCLDSPELLMALPLYQSTPLLTGAGVDNSESKSPAKRRKEGNLSATSWESIATLSHIPVWKYKYPFR